MCLKWLVSNPCSTACPLVSERNDQGYLKLFQKLFSSSNLHSMDLVYTGSFENNVHVNFKHANTVHDETYNECASAETTGAHLSAHLNEDRTMPQLSMYISCGQ